MGFSVVSWAYKEVATSAKLQQMVDNLVAHDHRPGGSQGAHMGAYRFAHGTVTLDASNASSVSGSVTFPAGRFPSPPDVFVQVVGTGIWEAYPYGQDATGFSVTAVTRLGGNASGSITVAWWAAL